MRDLEHREKRVNNVQMTGDKLLKDGHPARKTVEVHNFTFNNLCLIREHLISSNITDLTALTLSENKTTTE